MSKLLIQIVCWIIYRTVRQCCSTKVFLVMTLLVPLASFAGEPTTRLVMTGDILLAREVQREIARKQEQSPWRAIKTYLNGADWVMGNFEASVSDEKTCPPTDHLCFVVPSKSLGYLKGAGFTAVGIENNHSADAGEHARQKTFSAITEAGISAIDYEHSPGFYRSHNHIISFIALSNVPDKSGFKIDIPAHELRQKIRLAKSFSDWLIINIHWGAELADWAQPNQKAMAAWLIDQGVDVIIGHHPHVVQPVECIKGKPVFFSLGNHVFDQKYPQTKRGLIADCKINANELSCTGTETLTPTNSAFPTLTNNKAIAAKILENCRVPNTKPLVIDGYTIRPKLAHKQFMSGDIVLEATMPGKKGWMLAARHLLSAEHAQFQHQDKEENFFVTLETHHSSIDKELGPRPYVYKVTDHGLVAKWRGSALAWPLIDAALLSTQGSTPGSTLDYLCALHRKDSFITLNPDTKETRTAVYLWNGFGFSGVDEPVLDNECRKKFNNE
jgi:hypothetical protein